MSVVCCRPDVFSPPSAADVPEQGTARLGSDLHF